VRLCRKPLPNAIIFIAITSIYIPGIGQNISQNKLESSAQACIPAHQFVELPESIAGTQTDTYGQTRVALGAYERISPDGRFILRSYSGGRLGDVSLIELSPDGRMLRAIDTPLKNEAFPVQGSWRYLVNTNGDHYTLESIVRSGRQAKPVFRGGMDGFYAAASELPSDKPGHVRIRSLSWPNSSGDPQTQGEGALVSRTIEVDVQRHRITADSGPVFHCRERLRQDGPLYALPMISVDGTEFSALPQTPVQGKQTMRIFGFGSDGKSCELRESFDFSSGKAIFGFSQGHQAAHVTWEYQGMAWWYSRELQKPFNIAPYELEGRKMDAQFELIASAFPGLARDGRVIYGATLKDCTNTRVQPSGRCRERAGYMISDPYQSNAYRNFMQTYKGPARQQCVTGAEVLKQREMFAGERKIN
jgi:hypothetical protein